MRGVGAGGPRVVCGASMHKCDEEEKQKLHISRWRTDRRR